MDLTYTIVQEVAARTGTDPMDMPPLYETVDPEALQRLVESSTDDTTTVTFSYCAYTVRVAGNGTIHVESRVTQ